MYRLETDGPLESPNRLNLRSKVKSVPKLMTVLSLPQLINLNQKEATELVP